MIVCHFHSFGGKMLRKLGRGSPRFTPVGHLCSAISRELGVNSSNFAARCTDLHLVPCFCIISQLDCNNATGLTAVSAHHITHTTSSIHPHNIHTISPLPYFALLSPPHTSLSHPLNGSTDVNDNACVPERGTSPRIFTEQTRKWTKFKEMDKATPKG